MARIITFSRTFPAYHHKAGQKTFFVEKFIRAWDDTHSFDTLRPPVNSFCDMQILKHCMPKNHTIREGKRFKKGDYFSPRVWSGKPYWSKMITIAPDTLITGVYSFEVTKSGYLLKGKKVDLIKLREIAGNDGLSSDDLELWFPKPFKGQIICWNKDITY